MNKNETKIPEVGMHATECIGSDRYPLKIVKVSDSGKTIWLCHLVAEPAEGYDYYSNQVHTFSDPEDQTPTVKATLRKDGKYRKCGCYSYGTVFIGTARKYCDPHF